MTPEEILNFKNEMWSNGFKELKVLKKEYEQKAQLIMEVMESKTNAAACKSINTFKGKSNTF